MCLMSACLLTHVKKEQKTVSHREIEANVVTFLYRMALRTLQRFFFSLFRESNHVRSSATVLLLQTTMEGGNVKWQVASIKDHTAQQSL